MKDDNVFELTGSRASALWLMISLWKDFEALRRKLKINTHTQVGKHLYLCCSNTFFFLNLILNNLLYLLILIIHDRNQVIFFFTQFRHTVSAVEVWLLLYLEVWSQIARTQPYIFKVKRVFFYKFFGNLIVSVIIYGYSGILWNTAQNFDIIRWLCPSGFCNLGPFY